MCNCFIPQTLRVTETAESKVNIDRNKRLRRHNKPAAAQRGVLGNNVVLLKQRSLSVDRAVLKTVPVFLFLIFHWSDSACQKKKKKISQLFSTLFSQKTAPSNKVYVYCCLLIITCQKVRARWTGAELLQTLQHI